MERRVILLALAATCIALLARVSIRAGEVIGIVFRGEETQAAFQAVGATAADALFARLFLLSVFLMALMLAILAGLWLSRALQR